MIICGKKKTMFPIVVRRYHFGSFVSSTAVFNGAVSEGKGVLSTSLLEPSSGSVTVPERKPFVEVTVSLAKDGSFRLMGFAACAIHAE